MRFYKFLNENSYLFSHDVNWLVDHFIRLRGKGNPRLGYKKLQWYFNNHGGNLTKEEREKANIALFEIKKRLK